MFFSIPPKKNHAQFGVLNRFSWDKNTLQRRGGWINCCTYSLPIPSPNRVIFIPSSARILLRKTSLWRFVSKKTTRRLFSTLHLCFHISPKVRAFLNVFSASRIFKRKKKREITRFGPPKKLRGGNVKICKCFCVFLKRTWHMVFEIKTSSWSIFAKLRLFSTLWYTFLNCVSLH